MPNIKSAKKRVLVSEAQNAKNRAVKSAVRTKIKRFDAALAGNGDAVAAHKEAVAGIDQAVAKGVIHKNTASRKKSQMAKHLNAAK